MIRNINARIAFLVALISALSVVAVRLMVRSRDTVSDAAVHDHFVSDPIAGTTGPESKRNHQEMDSMRSRRESADSESLATQMVNIFNTDWSISGVNLRLLGVPEESLIPIKDELQNSIAALQGELAVAHGKLTLSSEHPSVRLPPLAADALADEMESLKKRLKTYAGPKIVRDIVAVLSRNLASVYGDAKTITMIESAWLSTMYTDELAYTLELRSDAGGNPLVLTSQSFGKLFPYVQVKATKANPSGDALRKYKESLRKRGQTPGTRTPGTVRYLVR